MKLNKQTFVKFFYLNISWPIIILVVAFMLFLPPPFLLNYEYGIVEKVYKGEIFIRKSRGKSIRCNCTYLKFRHSEKIYNSIYTKHRKIIEESNIAGKEISLWYAYMGSNDNEIRIIKHESNYIIPYDWVKGSIIMVIITLSFIWIILVIIDLYKKYKVKKRAKKGTVRKYSLTKVG